MYKKTCERHSRSRRRANLFVQCKKTLLRVNLMFRALVVDEAAQLGFATLATILNKYESIVERVILGGDPRQLKPHCELQKPVRAALFEVPS